MIRHVMLIGAAAMTMAVSACGGKNAPDEFMVLKNPSLSVPPEYHLRPPGDDNVADTYTPEELARQALFGE
ncbi:DUF3035 domain-containing protein [Emcibacter sp.]|uniref:DUF3035 domain-containing protein n=1 Tax=Emcibacter sp. TaxID=1979954 RepID=UPI002AA80241|nr:DUF3035 domain-containing protein [Emcibacter sp.]